MPHASSPARLRSAAGGRPLEALERLYHYPLAHFFLGVALRGMKEYVQAAGAFRMALSLNPGLAHAHQYLASILASRPQRSGRRCRAPATVAHAAFGGPRSSPASSGCACRQTCARRRSESRSMPSRALYRITAAGPGTGKGIVVVFGAIPPPLVDSPKCPALLARWNLPTRRNHGAAIT